MIGQKRKRFRDEQRHDSENSSFGMEGSDIAGFKMEEKAGLAKSAPAGLAGKEEKEDFSKRFGSVLPFLFLSCEKVLEKKSVFLVS